MKKDLVQFSISLRKQDIRRLEKVAKDQRRSRSKMVRIMIEDSLDAYEKKV